MAKLTAEKLEERMEALVQMVKQGFAAAASKEDVRRIVDGRLQDAERNGDERVCNGR